MIFFQPRQGISYSIYQKLHKLTELWQVFLRQTSVWQPQKFVKLLKPDLCIFTEDFLYLTTTKPSPP